MFYIIKDFYIFHTAGVLVIKELKVLSTVIARGKLIKDQILKFKILFVSKPFSKKTFTGDLG